MTTSTTGTAVKQLAYNPYLWPPGLTFTPSGPPPTRHATLTPKSPPRPETTPGQIQAATPASFKVFNAGKSCAETVMKRERIDPVRGIEWRGFVPG